MRPPHVAVLSTHLDDAVLSVGAAIAGWGNGARVVTVLADRVERRRGGEQIAWTEEEGP
jgi:LmbE family N-acetylglucosaminyl deacetylase